MHFLLDTNIFVDFVKDTKDEHFIEQIIKLADDGTIQILAPDVLISEWNEKREKTLEYISKMFASTINSSKNETTAPLLKDDYKHSQAKAASIDKLLANGIFIKTPQKVKVETVDRSMNHKAPFHDRKTKTINDALIYFTSVYYLKRNKIPLFVFITKDSGDFGAPENRNEVINPELEDPSLTIFYFTSLFKCFDKLRDRLIIKQPDKEGTYQLIISKRGSKHLLDHLYDVIATYRSKINFLPTHILSKIEPFRIIDFRHDYAYHSGNILLTNNKLLLDFFKQVDIKKMRFKKDSEFRNTKENLEKLNYIVTCLNENMVFNISYVTQGERINIHKEINKDCICAYCSYRRLSLGIVLNEIYNEKDELRRAFVLFQIGKFNESLIIYNNIYQNAVKEDNKILAYRILLILHWVAQHAEHESDDSDKTLIRKVSSLDREKAFLSVLNGSKLDKEIALFLHGNSTKECY